MTFRLETERLYLCEWTGDEADAFLPIAQDPRVMRFISGGEPYQHPQVREFIGRQLAYQESRGYSLWKLVRKSPSEDGGRLIGFCGLQPLAGTDEVEVGYWLAADCWGKGLATEAATRALQFAFNDVNLAQVVAVAMPANLASRKVMEHLGMRYIGETQHKGFHVVKYAITAAEFRAQRIDS